MRRVRVWLIVALLLVVLATAVCVADNKLTGPAPSGDAEARKAQAAAPVPSTDELNRASQSFVQLAKVATPAVVNLDVEKRVSGTRFFASPFGRDDPFRDFFERFGIPDQDRVQRGQGSGFIISDDGYIITNNHVVSDADKVNVRLLDGRSFKADLIGNDPKTDLALLKIKDPEKLPVLPLGDSSKMEVGEWVIAIGNPFGLSNTVTAGIVSAKGRVIGAGPYDDFIQTDASINPGNSGGPLINTHGEVIGINAMINASGQGIGFAIPSNLAKGIVDQLKSHGSVTRGWLGVLIQPLTKDLAKALSLPESEGALVGEVVEGSPAEEAKFQRGDVILTFNGSKIKDSKDLPFLVAQTEIGRKVDVELIRDGKRMTVPVTVGKMPEEKGAGKAPSQKEELGLTLRDVPLEMAKQYRLKPGVGVLIMEVDQGSAAQDAGLHRGDVIVEANRKPLKDVKSFSEAIKNTDKGESILLLVKREEGAFFTTLTR